MTTWWQPVGTIAGLELRQRIRTTRWRMTLAVAFLAISLLVFGSRYAATATGDGSADGWARDFYAMIGGFVLLLGLVVAPSMTATSINGDRKDATLAVVQATPITAVQLALGKLLGGWAASLALLVVSAPYLIWAALVAPYSIATSLLGIVVAALLFLCYCGIGLGFSALSARPVSSAVLTQLTVFFMILGLPAIMGLLTPFVRETVVVLRPFSEYHGGKRGACMEVQREITVTHMERTWWLLVPNPFVVTADVVAQTDPALTARPQWRGDVVHYEQETILLSLGRTVSELRSGTDDAQDMRCADDSRDWLEDREYQSRFVGHTWYLGLAVNILIGVLGVLVAIRRLRVPVETLPRGVRIA
ncbi:ABC transporter permease subunit [Mycobacterium sp. NPDC050853]|uniref:ABC transporter permease n=1 Tax=Mycobacteriaceae TaxID=1762 RepID=UPI0015DFA740|nr:ABC transporter permease subunit [Mycobacteroides sp. LB1]